ncbi:hypothetical protein Hamer_G028883 [Homarus americanus]|uniref:Uncharacterized protein n=1 Tax=Homarus americanus TaxID=6706 RepID=A0A8J5KD18_HOMAM|nr:hypothetical protein Hamer_G028883 [Homarus americanus]
MARYLTCLTWLLLLALCFTPTPAHSERFGMSSDGRRGYGGVDATKPNSGALIHNPSSNYRPPVVPGPRPRPRPKWYYN